MAKQLALLPHNKKVLDLLEVGSLQGGQMVHPIVHDVHLGGIGEIIYFIFGMNHCSSSLGDELATQPECIPSLTQGNWFGFGIGKCNLWDRLEHSYE